MLDLAFNPYVDAILREHVVRNAQKLGLALADVEDVLTTPEDAVEWLKEVSLDAYHAYVEDADRAVNHVGWIVMPKRPGAMAE